VRSLALSAAGEDAGRTAAGTAALLSKSESIPKEKAAT
jgi:hypothetical protein